MRKFDGRKSQNNIHKGWAAIHYAACLGHLEVFKALFMDEYDLLIDCDSEVIVNGKKIAISAGSSLVHIAVASNQTGIINYIIENFEQQEFSELVGQPNDAGETALFLCAKYSSGIQWAKNERVLSKELS